MLTARAADCKAIVGLEGNPGARAIRAPGLPARDGCLGLQQEFCRPAASLRAESRGEEVLQLVAIIFRLAGST